MKKPRSTPLQFLRSRFKIEDNSLWRVLGLLKPYRRQVVIANILLAFSSTLGGLALVSLHPLFSATFKFAEADRAKAESVEVRSETALDPMTVEADATATGDQAAAEQTASAEAQSLLGGEPESGSSGEAGFGPADGDDREAKIRGLIAKSAFLQRQVDAGERQWERIQTWMQASLGRFVAIYSCMIMLLFVFKGLVEFGGNLIMANATIRVTSGVMRDVYSNVLRQEMLFFHNTSTGALLNTCYREVFQLRQIIKFLASTRIMLPVNAAILFGALMIISLPLTLLLLVMLPIVILPMMLLTRKLRKALAGELAEESGAMDVMTEGFTGIQAIKAFGAEQLESDYLEPSLERIVRMSRKRRAAQALTGPVVDVLNMFVLLCVFVIAMFALPSSVQIDQSRVVIFLFGITRFYKPFRTMMSMNIKMQRAGLVAKRIFGFLDRKPKIKDSADAVEFPSAWNEIVFDDVSLTYRIKAAGKKGRQSRPALRHVNLRIGKGEKIALVGPNGAGKSSIVNLLCRLYDATGGEVQVGGVALNAIRLGSIRDNICLITQNPVMFNRPVAENIAFGLEGVTPEQIVEAARITGADAFIEKLPHGYDTLIGEQGRLLSGGERQKVVLARAFVRKPEVLILDEPTAGFDPAATADFLRFVGDERHRDLTIIYITHERSYLSRFDRILRMTEDRNIVEESIETLQGSEVGDEPLVGHKYPG